MDENFRIGNFICELRKSKGLSQTELGNKLNVTNKAVSRWETGRGLPDSSLLLPLAKELGVTVDEILQGKLFTSGEGSISSKKSEEIKKQNAVFDYKGIKKQLIRDSLIVIPTFIFICVWLSLGLNPNIDLTPSADYITSVTINLLLPLMVIGIFQIVYAFFLIRDSIRMQGRAMGMKILICIGIYYAVVHLFFFVYIFRIIRFFVLKNRVNKINNIC
ncbi:MAG: helix-turn-helix transcriptional regulator [Clostridia bacterium]|nr:helix-turn-helix transcriptional regulator [Clostridia bacterium]